jgi:hypothetical protein
MIRSIKKLRITSPPSLPQGLAEWAPGLPDKKGLRYSRHGWAHKAPSWGGKIILPLWWLKQARRGQKTKALPLPL